jgi:hypothetical protein
MLINQLASSIKMDKNTLNFWTDIAILLSFIACFATGIIKWPWILVKLNLEYSTYNLISAVHDWSGLVMGIFSLVHIILHWKWIVAMTKTKLGMRGEKNETGE